MKIMNKIFRAPAVHILQLHIYQNAVQSIDANPLAFAYHFRVSLSKVRTDETFYTRMSVTKKSLSQVIYFNIEPQTPMFR